jgi:hypothetical protein
MNMDKLKAIKAGLKFEGPVEISGKKFASRLTVTGVEDLTFQYEYEKWTEEFGEKLNVFTGTGELSTSVSFIIMKWKDEDSEYRGEYSLNAHMIWGDFVITQGEHKGEKGVIVTRVVE